MKKAAVIMLPLVVLASCTNEVAYDATGTFEATEITVCAESNGKILSLSAQEGATVTASEVLGVIDTVQLSLQRQQLQLQQSAMLSTKPDVEKQVGALRNQISKYQADLVRVGNLLKDNAATQKQYDDVKAALDMSKSQLKATLSTLNSQSESINNNASALEIQIQQLDDRLSKCYIKSPIDGTVLVRYVNAGEIASAGRPVMKVADLNSMFMRAYFTSDQLASIKLGDTVTVIADFGGDQQRSYEGVITWISAESEFTPKSIQTRNSRANLVYATKIAVKNDGYLKIGMYGEVELAK